MVDTSIPATPASGGLWASCCNISSSALCCLGACTCVTCAAIAAPFVLSGGTKKPDRFHLPGQRCGECQKDIAMIVCINCKEVYCKACCRNVHSKGYRSEHKEFELIPGSCGATCAKPRPKNSSTPAKPKPKAKASAPAPSTASQSSFLHDDQDVRYYLPKQLCGDCEVSYATYLCLNCKEVYCLKCKIKVHSKGLRKEHNLIVPIGDHFEPEFDEERTLAALEVARAEERRKASNDPNRASNERPPGVTATDTSSTVFGLD